MNDGRTDNELVTYGWSAATAAWKAPFEGTEVAGWSAALVMHAKKGRTWTSTAETLIVLLQLLVYKLL